MRPSDANWNEDCEIALDTLKACHIPAMEAYALLAELPLMSCQAMVLLALEKWTKISRSSAYRPAESSQQISELMAVYGGGSISQQVGAQFKYQTAKILTGLLWMIIGLVGFVAFFVLLIH